MSIDFFKVLTFLTEHAKHEALLPDAWGTVRAVAAAVSGGRIGLADAVHDAPVAGYALAAALERLTGGALETMAVVPLRCGMPNASSMTLAAFRSVFQGPLGLPEDVLDRPTSVALYEVVDECFAEPVERAVAATLAEGPWKPFAATIAADVVDALYRYLAHVIADDAIGAVAYGEYLAGSMRALIVGEMADKPGTWVAVAA